MKAFWVLGFGRWLDHLPQVLCACPARGSLVACNVSSLRTAEKRALQLRQHYVQQFFGLTLVVHYTTVKC